MLKECLSSIIQQTFTDFEVLVGNDYTKETLSSEMLNFDDPRIKFMNWPKNLGEMENMNALLAMSRGRYFTWLADDDMYMPDFLYAVYTSINKFDFPTYVFTSYFFGRDFPGKLEGFNNNAQLLTGRQFLKMYLARQIKTQGCYGVCDVKFLKQFGGVEKLGERLSHIGGFSLNADQLLAIRAGLLKKVVYIDASLIFFRGHEQSLSLSCSDVDAYSSAHMDLWSKSIEVFKSEEIKDDFRINLFLLLKWCLSDYCAVMYRSGVLQYRELILYLLSMKSYIRLLGNHRHKMVMTILHRVGRLIVSHLKRRILQIIQNLNSNITNH